MGEDLRCRMSLNWSFEVILTFASLVPFLISFSISLRQYLHSKFQHNFFLCLTWLSYFLWGFCHGLSKLLLSKPLYWFSGLFITGYLVTIILFGESLEYDLKLSKYLILVLILQSLIVVSLYDEKFVIIEVYQNQEMGLKLNHPLLQFPILLEMLLSTLFVIIIMVKIYRNAPLPMRPKTLLALLGVGVFSSIGLLYVFLRRK